jgi:hypothetical protein
VDSETGIGYIFKLLSSKELLPALKRSWPA